MTKSLALIAISVAVWLMVKFIGTGRSLFVPSECLALVDIDKIKSFIFAAPYLREIRGSSRILAKLNDPDEVRQRVIRRGGKLLYAGGGSVLAKFPSLIQAQSFIDNERLELEKETKGGATLTGVREEIDVNGFGPAIRRAQARLHDAKGRRRTLLRNPPSLLLKPCQSCGIRPAQTFNQSRQRLACQACDERICGGEEAETRQLYTRFRSGLKASWLSAQSADDLKALAATSKNYIGVIRADGNAMGERIKRLADIGDENLFSSFSAACRDATEGAVLSALRKAYCEPRSFRSQKVFPFEFVLLGGDDDVEIITTADQAIQVAINFCDEFTRRMKRFADGCGHPYLAVAMSAGVALAQSSYPISSLDDLAEQLLKSAKARSRQISPDSITPTIDFMVVTASTSASLATVRTKEYQRERQRFTQRPYTTAELGRVFDEIRNMKSTSDGDSPFPRNKLQSLYELFFPFRGKEQVELQYLILQRRLSDAHREMLRRLNEAAGAANAGHSPWRELDDPAAECDTCLADMVELYEFVPEACSTKTATGPMEAGA